MNKNPKGAISKKPVDKKHRLHELRTLLENKKSDILRVSSSHNVLEKGIARGDLVDLSTDLNEREFMLELAEHDRAAMLQIDQALAMIDGGSYGTCEQCGDSIDQNRLVAMPTARFCISCQSKLERTNNINRTPD